MEELEAFDPLEAKTIADTEVAANALKKEIENILSAYFGWFDPFCELIQNALDSVDEKKRNQPENYEPRINITIDLDRNQLTVCDNGTGLTEAKYRQFLAPSFSFKNGKQFRGHKGIGATYLAYGFNSIKIETKTSAFSTRGVMEGAKSWLSDPAPEGNPKIRPDDSKRADSDIEEFESGVSITLSFDQDTFPGDLSWMSASRATQWEKILRVKTGLGAVKETSPVRVMIKVISNGDSDEVVLDGAEYFWPHETITKAVQLRDLESEIKKQFEKSGPNFKLPAKFRNIECVWDRYDVDELVNLLEFSDEEVAQINLSKPTVYFAYMYTSEVWKTFNDSIGHRKSVSILSAGVQISANNMPQGEFIEIPLNRYTGRQNQISAIIHFDDAVPDPGRKGFQLEIVNICKTIGRKLIEHINRYKGCLRVKTGATPDLKREDAVDDWKREMEEHQAQSPLTLTNEHFFLPTSKISVLSTPTREQDVIALFNQLIAGGVIRGIRIMSTNERFTYDGMYRVAYHPPAEHHLYDENTNPLGVDATQIETPNEEYLSNAKILEYKLVLDALVEDIEDGDKNSNDIQLVVVWEIGTKYQANYAITSLLNPDNLALRQFHGLTHTLTNLNTGQHEMHMIALSDLIRFLNDPESEIARQEELYD